MDDKGFNNEGLGYDFSYDEKQKSQKTTVGCCIVFLAVVIIFILVFNLCSMYPRIWHPETQKNFLAIENYAAEKYPQAVKVRDVYRSSKSSPDGNPPDSAVYELNGVEFSISANNGTIHYDGYYQAKAFAFIEDEYLNKFFEPRGLSPEWYASFGSLPGETEVGDDLTEYTGTYTITFKLGVNENIYELSELSWLYDFYLFFKENCILQSYRVGMNLVIHNNEYCCIQYDESTEFSSSEEFYGAFEHRTLNGRYE